MPSPYGPNRPEGLHRHLLPHIFVASQRLEEPSLALRNLVAYTRACHEKSLNPVGPNRLPVRAQRN